MRFAPTILLILLSSFCYAQNVGIGITTPAVPLHIRNSGSELLRLQGNDPFLSFFNNGGIAKGFVGGEGDNLNIGTSAGNSNGLIQFWNHNNLHMVIHPNSNVGIGTNVPSFKLTVQTANDNYGLIHRSNDIIVGSWIGLNGGTTGGWYGTYSDHPLMFFTNNAGPQITLKQSGNVGIGYTSPQTKLDVNGTLQATNIGIGTTSPQGRLHILGGGNSVHLQGNGSFIYFCDAVNTPKGFVWNNGGNNMDLGTEVGNNSGEVKLTIRGYQALTVQSDGRVRVGATASSHFVPISGIGLPVFTSFGPLCIKDANFPAADEWTWHSHSGLENLYLYKNGGFITHINADGQWVVGSDISLKEDIKPYKSVLPNISKLEVSTYHYKRNAVGQLSFGLIAQNVEQYFPEIVSEIPGQEGQKLLGISYAKTGVLAIKAIQEQQEIIETQQKNIESQQREIDELKKRLALLESRLK